MRRADHRLLLLLCVLATEAGAHSGSISHSSWREDGGNGNVIATVRVSAAVLAQTGLDLRDPAIEQRLDKLAREGFELRNANGACPLTTLAVTRDTDAASIRLRAACPAPTALQVRWLLERIPAHVHMLRLERDGQQSGPHALSAARQHVAWPAASGAARIDAPAFFELGLRHILGGWDHLLFVLLLVAAATRPVALLWLVSGFTLGHSLTLLLAATGAARPPAATIEAFIALTIVCTALELLLRTASQRLAHALAATALLAGTGVAAGVLPPLLLPAALLLVGGLVAGQGLARAGVAGAVLTLLFGLVHGFGFANVLAELAPGATVPLTALLGFNLGIEAGQLLVVVPAWWLLKNRDRWRGEWLPAAALAAGTAWFLQRVMTS